MHKKFSKAVAGSLMSAAMLATAVTSVLAPMSASAGELLGQTDFEDGTGLPWHTCETNPAKQKFEIKLPWKISCAFVYPPKKYKYKFL